MDLFSIIVALVGTGAAIFAAVCAFLTRRDYLRDTSLPYRFDVVSEGRAKIIIFVNPRNSGCIVEAVHIDVLGDGTRLVSGALFLGKSDYPPYSVPGGTFVLLHPAYSAYNSIAVNVSSRIVVRLSGGETAKSDVGILFEVYKPSAARQKENAGKVGVAIKP